MKHKYLKAITETLLIDVSDTKLNEISNMKKRLEELNKCDKIVSEEKDEVSFMLIKLLKDFNIDDQLYDLKIKGSYIFLKNYEKIPFIEKKLLQIIKDYKLKKEDYLITKPLQVFIDNDFSRMKDKNDILDKNVKDYLKKINFFKCGICSENQIAEAYSDSLKFTSSFFKEYILTEKQYSASSDDFLSFIKLVDENKIDIYNEQDNKINKNVIESIRSLVDITGIFKDVKEYFDKNELANFEKKLEKNCKW